mmetsp:Transcript_1435/g.5116  ORF Transcript_1435/g.5116 Transcript_1435/m.5116 type:complete len:411 (-) Transcript_1435:394-1626(-)
MSSWTESRLTSSVVASKRPLLRAARPSAAAACSDDTGFSISCPTARNTRRHMPAVQRRDDESATTDLSIEFALREEGVSTLPKCKVAFGDKPGFQGPFQGLRPPKARPHTAVHGSPSLRGRRALIRPEPRAALRLYVSTAARHRGRRRRRRRLDAHVPEADLRVVVVLLGSPPRLVLVVGDLVELGRKRVDARRVDVVGDDRGPLLVRVRLCPVRRRLRLCHVLARRGAARGRLGRRRPHRGARPGHLLRVDALVVVNGLAVVAKGVLEVFAVLCVLDALLGLESPELFFHGYPQVRAAAVERAAEVRARAVPLEQVDPELASPEERLDVARVVLEALIQVQLRFCQVPTTPQRQSLVEQQRDCGCAAAVVLSEVDVAGVHGRVLGLDHAEEAHTVSPRRLGAAEAALRP